MTLYVNGVPGTNGNDFTIVSGAIYTDLFGLGNVSIANNFLIDEVGVWSRTLSPGEVKSLFGNGYGVAYDSALLLPEPAASRANNWRGRSLASGALRGTNGSSIFYTFVDDKNANGVIDFADDFVVAEYLVSGAAYITNTVVRQRIASQAVAQSYSLASVNFLNRSNEVFFTGEPDGQVFAWTATGTNPMQQQLFSSQYAGKAWHALAGVKTLEPGEGLAGLLVDPATPNKCDVILWPPQAELPGSASVPQTAPFAAVLPSTAPLGGIATVTNRLWDAEGNAATLYLQYLLAGATNWQDATLMTVDGTNYDSPFRVAASPGGVNHTVVWNALADIGCITTNVSLRARQRHQPAGRLVICHAVPTHRKHGLRWQRFARRVGDGVLRTSR